MTCEPEYFIPAGMVSTETEVKKSKFIATITAITSKEDILEFFQKIKEQNPGADHNCFAYIVGNPLSPLDIGFSDDGEPGGTAGKPMFGVLQHNMIGNAAVMVSRYFGGTKLGTGGLVRAYSAAVKMAVEEVSLNKYIPSTCVLVSIPFRFENNLRHLADALNLSVIELTYSDDVSITFNVPESELESFVQKVNDITRGAARLD